MDSWGRSWDGWELALSPRSNPIKIKELGILVGLILAVVGFVGWQRHRISTLKTKVVEGEIRERTLAKTARAHKRDKTPNKQLVEESKIGILVKPGYVVTLESFLLNGKEYRDCVGCEEDLAADEQTIKDMIGFREDDSEMIDKLKRKKGFWKGVGFIGGGLFLGTVTYLVIDAKRDGQ